MTLTPFSGITDTSVSATRAGLTVAGISGLTNNGSGVTPPVTPANYYNPGISGATPLEVWSPVIKPQSYSGKAFTVRDSTGANTLDIAYLASGIADFATADAFGLSGGSTYWTVDEVPGTKNGYNLTPRSSAFRPRNFNHTVSGLRSITFSGTATMDLQNNSLPIAQVRNVTIIDVIRPWHGHRGMRFWGLDTTTNRLNLDLLTNSGFSPGHAMTALTQPIVVAYNTNGTGNRRLQQNQRVSTASSAPTANAATGIIFGQDVSGGSASNYELLSRIIFDGTLTQPQIDVERAEATRAFGIRTAQKPMVIMFGDSLMQWQPNGTNGIDRSFGYRLPDYFNADLDFTNLGNLGEKASTMVAANFQTLLDRSFVTGVRNDCIIEYSSNDIAANETAAACYANLVTLADKAYLKGCTKVAFMSPIVRNGLFSGGQNAAGFETFRNDLRTLMLAGIGVDFDVLIDAGGDAALGNPSNASNTACLYDFVHPTDAWYDILTNNYFIPGVLSLTT